MKRQFLAFWLRHKQSEKQYFKWDWDMIWLLIKYKLIKRKKIYFTCVKACDREEYFIEFYAE